MAEVRKASRTFEQTLSLDQQGSLCGVNAVASVTSIEVHAAFDEVYHCLGEKLKHRTCVSRAGAEPNSLSPVAVLARSSQRGARHRQADR